MKVTRLGMAAVALVVAAAYPPTAQAGWWDEAKAWVKEYFPGESSPAPAPAPKAPAPAPGASGTVKQLPPPVGEPEQKVKPKTYVVKKGDTLSGRFGDDADVVCELNKLKSCNRIMVGMVLKLKDNTYIYDPQLPTRKKVAAKAKTVQPKVKTEVKSKQPTKVKGEILYTTVGRAPLLGCGKKDVSVINEEAWKALGLSEEDRVYLRLNAGHEPRLNLTAEEGLVRIPRGERLEQVTFCRKGKVVAVGPMRTAWSADTPVYAQRFVLPSGRAVAWMRNCSNWIPWHAPVVKAPPVVQPPAVVAPPVVQPPAVVQPPPPAAPPPPLSVIPKQRDAAEWEVIVGAGVWDNKLAHGDWQYAEGMLSAILPDGYRVGAGLYGMRGSGESETSAYSWREKGYGPQIGVKRNFLKPQTDAAGQQTLLPAQWGVKARFLRDSVSGGNPDSGYSMSQTGRKIGLYGEYMERKDADWMVGVNGEIWAYGSGHINSTWSGDTPQDRGSWNANAWAQYRIDSDWQARGIVGVAHQNWDDLNWLRLSAEARYKETFMCGPSVALALNKPAQYAGVSKSDLTTLGFSCRAEFGGVIRTLDREQREASVQYVGPVEPQAP